MKRVFDIVTSAFGLTITSPMLVFFMFLIWLQDFYSPFYVAPRVGWNGRIFRMVKLRSMVVGADKSGVDSTSTADHRVTWIGRIVRRYKLDEISQLWNVLKGDMSFVGPRPNVLREVALYTDEERNLLDVRPGITDLASIVFSDEGEILGGSENPDIRYNQVIRPWKSRLGLLYVNKRTFLLDLEIIALTAVAIFSRRLALRGLQSLLVRLGADDQLLKAARRDGPLQAYPPPGLDRIVTSREPLTTELNISTVGKHGVGIRD